MRGLDSDLVHKIDLGPQIYLRACRLGLEMPVSSRVAALQYGRQDDETNRTCDEPNQ
jgi:hypothetical protein